MKVGDKLRVKGHDLEPYFHRGQEGNIVDINEYTDEVKMRFDNGEYFNCEVKSFKNYFDLINTETKLVCPVVLKVWYKACEPYIGVKNE